MPTSNMQMMSSSAVAAEEKRQDSAQKDAVERHEAMLEEAEMRNLRPLVNTKLAVKEFVGRIPGEPVKEQEEEDNKAGQHGFGPGVIDAVSNVKTVPLKVHDKVVDRIVVDPLPHGGQLPGATMLTEPQRVQAVLDEHTGNKGKAKGASKAELEEAEKATVRTH